MTYNVRGLIYFGLLSTFRLSLVGTFIIHPLPCFYHDIKVTVCFRLPASPSGTCSWPASISLLPLHDDFRMGGTIVMSFLFL